MKVAASFFSIHIIWDAWADSGSGLGGKVLSGCHAIELALFERNILQEISNLTCNWRVTLSSASDLINFESERVYEVAMARHMIAVW